MTKYLHLLTVSVILSIAFASTSLAQQTIRRIPSEFGQIPYLEYLPSDYDSSTQTYPLLVFLHGSGEQGDGSDEQVWKVAEHGPPRHIQDGHDMTFTVDGQPQTFIVISPQLLYNSGSWADDYLDRVMQHVLRSYRVDSSRIYLTGLSLGGGGVWRYGGKQARLLAAIAPVCGAQNVQPDLVETMIDHGLPVWAFHGEADLVVPISNTKNWIEALNDRGADPAPKFTAYPGVGHEGAWQRAYSIDHQQSDPNLYEWLLLQRKGGAAHPANQPPVARAGADTTLQLPVEQVQLRGNASSDSDGRIVAYTWSMIGGPSEATLSGQHTASLTVRNVSQGVYTFALKVTDNRGATHTDQVRVTIAAAPPPPAVTARAGPDQTVIADTAELVVQGHAQGPNPFPFYQWEKVSGPDLAWSAQETTLTITHPSVGRYRFRFTARDSAGYSDSDEMVLTVTDKQASATDTQPENFYEVVALPDMNRPAQWQVYPNPAHRSVTVSLPLSAATGGVLQLADLSGRVLYQAPVRALTLQVATDRLAEGVYLLRWYNTAQRQVAKLLVDH